MAAAAVVLGTAAGLGRGSAAADPVPHAQYLNLQWGLSAIGAPTAWANGSGAGVRIGIVDTGVDTDQQDLQGKVVDSTVIESSPSSGCAQPTTAQDDNGHGTHVAGIAAASGAHGVDGAAPGASLVVAKVLDCQGSGTYQDVIAGIDWVVSHGARVVNLSLGDAGTGLVDQSQVTGNPLAGALQDAWNHGAIGVVAAGNNSNGVLGLGEANFTNVPAVVVAATGPNGTLASYSNSIDRAQWGVAAPGGDDPNGPTAPTCGANDPNEILSTYWTAGDAAGCYATDEGTSMATPFVSGTLALLLGRGLSANQAVQTLLATAAHTVSCGSACSGLVNAAAAMQATSGRRAPAAAAAAAPPASSAPSTTTAHGPRPLSIAGAPSTSVATTVASTSTAPTTAPAPFVIRHKLTASTHHQSGAGTPWWSLLGIGFGVALLGGAVLVARRKRLLKPSST